MLRGSPCAIHEPGTDGGTKLTLKVSFG
jgi:hypothetical protein